MGEPKALMEVSDKTFVQRAVDVLSLGGCAPVVVETSSGTTLASSIALQRAHLLPILLWRMKTRAAGATMIIPHRHLVWQLDLPCGYDAGNVSGAVLRVHVL